MGYLVLSFFGIFEARVGNKPLINFRSAKIQGLLIYLALTQNKAHTRDELAALFWPNEPEKSAKQNLRQSLYRLRRFLAGTDNDEQQPLLVTRTTVQFNPACDHRLDVAQFLDALADGDLEAAVSLYRGDLLPSFSCNSLPFDDWLRQEREQCHRQVLDAFNILTNRGLTGGDFSTAERFARQQLRLERWREEAHRQLMQALALQGERTAALTQYETCVAVLAEELGITPAAATNNLAQNIRDAQIATQPSRPDSAPRLIIPFVGRKSQFETLVKTYQRVALDGLQAVTLSGKAGIGKTRLTQQFSAWVATQGADVLHGRAYETGAGLSYQPLIHLLRKRIDRENAPDDLLTDLWLSQLARLLPELRDRYPDLPPPTHDENTGRQHLFEAITRLGLALAARRPLLLFIDDWHWADTASLDVVQYALQRWAEEKAPIFVLLSLRQEALTEAPDLQSWLNQLKRSVSVAQIDLEALSQVETEQMVQRLLNPALENGTTNTSTVTQFSNWLFSETDGQPLFLTEALKVLAEAGVVRSEPALSLPKGQANGWQLDLSRFNAQRAKSSVLVGVREIVQGWLSRISVSATELLAATSVLSQSATFDNLCRVSGLAEQETLTLLEVLLNRQLLVETEASQTMTADPVYTFSHQKVSEVVYAETSIARRRLLHRRAFEALHASVSSAESAHHALHAGLLAETIQHSLIAGNEAMALFAVRVAIPHYETALQLIEQKGWPEEASGADRQALYSRLGRAYELNESWEKAEEIYKEMITFAQSIKAKAIECQGLNSLATIYYLSLNRLEQAVALLERALSISEQSGDQRGMAEAVWNLAMVANQKDDVSLTLHYSEKAIDLARDLQHPQFMARHLSILSYIHLKQLRWSDVEASAMEASRLYTESGNLVLAAECQRGGGFGQLMSGKLQAALTTLEKTAVFSQQIENLWGQAQCSWQLAFIRLELGDYDQAIKLSKQGVEEARKLNLPEMLHLALAVWGTVHRTIMALGTAHQTLIGELLKSDESNLFAIVLDWVLAESCALHALSGDWDQATRYAKQRVQACEDDSLLSMGLTGWYEIEALLRSADSDLARSEVERLAGNVGDNKRYQLVLLRSRAVLAQWDGDVAQAIVHLEAALALAQEIGLPGEEWPILGELGKLHVEQGERAKGQEAYEAAAVIVHRLAETIDDEGLRNGFLSAGPVQTVL